ncbi:MAG: PTS sugar transporter subunit IIA [Endomicrobiia bacterium]
MKTGIIVLSHGKFSQELVNTAFSIVGHHDMVEEISVISEIDLNSLCERIKQKMSEMQADNIVLLTDMLGGTPCNASLMLCKNSDNIFVISGVNLYMLITAITARTQINDINEYVNKIISAGKNSIINVKERFLKNLNSTNNKTDK